MRGRPEPPRVTLTALVDALLAVAIPGWRALTRRSWCARQRSLVHALDPRVVWVHDGEKMPWALWGANPPMGDRFNVRPPVNEDPKVREVEALHVKELAGEELEAELAGALPVVLDFHDAGSKACEALAPRFAAVAEKFAGKVRFLKVLRSGNARLATRLGVTATPTLVFLAGGEEKGERLSGEDIKRTDVKARVEAMIGVAAVAHPA